MRDAGTYRSVHNIVQPTSPPNPPPPRTNAPSTASCPNPTDHSRQNALLSAQSHADNPQSPHSTPAPPRPPATTETPHTHQSDPNSPPKQPTAPTNPSPSSTHPRPTRLPIHKEPPMNRLRQRYRLPIIPPIPRRHGQPVQRKHPHSQVVMILPVPVRPPLIHLAYP